MTPTFENTPYSPLFMKFPPPPPGWEDHFFVHYFEFSVPTTGLQRQPMPLEQDADFYWRATMGSTDEIFQMQFFDAFGNPIASDLDFALNVQNFRQPVGNWPELFCPKGSTPSVTVTNSGGVATTITIALVGVKRYKKHG